MVVACPYRRNSLANLMGCLAKYNKLVPLNRMANPEDIAGTVLFLCSDAASYIAGRVIMIDGGCKVDREIKAYE